ncbi:hypothetical protein [uncultured Fibrobacter sp.]|jgi:hypothetical protein|uniref:hypothetical protein n=1 Tax=uncultured Fibrobacter sp. TaxID=261512 RepID=UPI00262FF703|nr:hypothetical protein [uncultured Fibrobacter sp.]
MRFFTSRKPALLNFSLLFMFLATWLISYMMPAIRGLLQEEHLFYGTISHAAIPSIFGGSNIPFFDKTTFQINGDDQATFVLYASKEMLDDMSDWFSFAAINAGDIPLEISASRIDEKNFVVHSIASTDGEMDFDTLVMDYQVYYGFIGCAIVLAMVLASLVLFILWVVKKRK